MTTITIPHELKFVGIPDEALVGDAEGVNRTLKMMGLTWEFEGFSPPDAKGECEYEVTGIVPEGNE